MKRGRLLLIVLVGCLLVHGRPNEEEESSGAVNDYSGDEDDERVNPDSDEKAKREEVPGKAQNESKAEDTGALEGNITAQNVSNVNQSELNPSNNTSNASQEALVKGEIPEKDNATYPSANDIAANESNSQEKKSLNESSAPILNESSATILNESSATNANESTATNATSKKSFLEEGFDRDSVTNIETADISQQMDLDMDMVIKNMATALPASMNWAAEQILKSMPEVSELVSNKKGEIPSFYDGVGDRRSITHGGSHSLAAVNTKQSAGLSAKAKLNLDKVTKSEANEAVKSKKRHHHHHNRHAQKEKDNMAVKRQYVNFENADGKEDMSLPTENTVANMGDENGRTSNANAMMSNIQREEIQMAMPAPMPAVARRSRGGTIRFMTNTNTLPQKIPEVSEFTQQQQQPTNNRLADVGEGMPSLKERMPSLKEAVPSLREETGQNDAGKYVSTVDIEGERKNAFSEETAPQQQQESSALQGVMDMEHKYDVFIDGSPADSSKLERPGNWKLGQVGQVGQITKAMVVKKRKPATISDMIDNMVPVDKGEAQATHEENDVPGMRGEGTLIRDVTPSDGMIHQIFKNGDRPIDSNDGRTELKSLLTIRSDKDIQNAAISDDSLKSIMQRSGNEISTPDSGLMNGGQIVKALPQNQMAAAESEENIMEGKPAMMTGDSRHQIQGQSEDLPPLSLSGIQNMNSQGQENVINDMSQQGTEASPNQQTLQARSSAVPLAAGAEPTEEMDAMVSNRKAESRQLPAAAMAPDTASYGAPMSVMKPSSSVAARQYKQVKLLPNSEVNVQQSAYEEQQPQQQFPVAEFRSNKFVEPQVMKRPKMMHFQSRMSLPQRNGQFQMLHFRRGNTAKKYHRVASQTKEGQAIKSVDFDDSHSTISLGAKRSKISISRKRSKILNKMKSKIDKKEKRQYLQQAYTEDQLHMAPSAGISTGSVNSANIGSATIGSSIGTNIGSSSLGSNRRAVSRQLPAAAVTTDTTSYTAPMGVGVGSNRGNSGSTSGQTRTVESGGSMESAGNGMETTATDSLPMMSGAPSMGAIGNAIPENFNNGGDSQGYDNMAHMDHNMGDGMGRGMMEGGGMAKGMMGGGMEGGGMEGGGMMGGGMMENSMHGNGMMQGSMVGGGTSLINGNDKSIDKEMAMQDKNAADTSARNEGTFVGGGGHGADMNANGGAMGGFKGFRGGNSSLPSYGESNVMTPTDEVQEGDSYEDTDAEDNEASQRSTKSSDSPKQQEVNEINEDTDLNHEIADQVVKNRQDEHNGNIIHGTPCMDCHTSGPIGHGAVITGSEAKKIGLNDESYLKRLGIKECKIKGPGFSEGNHGGAISDEWAKKLDGFDKKYLQQLGIPEEALEGNTASRDCKFVERIAEVMQVNADETEKKISDAPKEPKEPKEVKKAAAPAADSKEQAVKNQDEGSGKPAESTVKIEIPEKVKNVTKVSSAKETGKKDTKADKRRYKTKKMNKSDTKVKR